MNGNLIVTLPESMKYLVKLNTLKISRNRIEKPDDIINLRQLSALKNLTINENPISKTSGYIELCAYINDQIEVDYLIEYKYSLSLLIIDY